MTAPQRKGAAQNKEQTQLSYASIHVEHYTGVSLATVQPMNYSTYITQGAQQRYIPYHYVALCNGKHASLSLHPHAAPLGSKLRWKYMRQTHRCRGATLWWFSKGNLSFKDAGQGSRSSSLHRRIQSRPQDAFPIQPTAFRNDR